MTIKGIDVSANNADEFSLTGSDFVFIKATEGRSYINPKQSRQAARARTAGMVVGFYAFLWPGNIKAQAAYFVEKCASLPGDLLVCDWETTTAGTHATGAEKDAFLHEVKRLRPTHKVLLYCNRDFWFHHDTTSEAEDGLWIADPSNPAGHPGVEHPWLIHQYGISGGLDRNVAAFGSRAAMRAWAAGTQQEDPMTISKADADLIAERLLNKDGLIVNANPASAETNPFVAPKTSFERIERVARSTEMAAHQLLAAMASVSMTGLTDAQMDRLADIVADKLAERLGE